MNLFNRFLNVTLLSVLISFTGIILAEDEFSGVKIQNCTDVFLWFGSDRPKEFDSALMKNETEKKEALKRGLNLFEDGARNRRRTNNVCFDQELLTEYYHQEKQFKKSLYWANECAERGSGFGMRMLYFCYFSGTGVMQDDEEAMKWLFLSLATGDETAKEVLKNHEKTEGFNSFKSVIRGKQMAKEWEKAHPKAFFNPD